MALLSGFAHDVFVSYAHVDNEDGGLSGRWVSEFTQDLTIALKQRIGGADADKLSVFFDNEHLEAGHRLAELRERVQRSALFVAILSPSYLRHWPMEEFKAFQEIASSSNRTIVIDRIPLDEEDEYPPALRELIRRPFFARAEDTKVANPVGRMWCRQQYFERIQDLAVHLARRMKELRNGAGEAPPVVGGPEELNPDAAILLGRVTDDLHGQREQLRRHLEQYGLKIVPDDDYPDGSAVFRDRFLADIKAVNQGMPGIFVQLAGPYPSRRPAELPTGYERFQLDAARAAGLQTVLWRSSELDLATVSDEAQAGLLASADATTLPALKAKLTALCEPKPPDSASPPPFVFLNSDQSDIELAEELRKKLAENRFDVAIPRFGDNMRADLEDNLKLCEALILIFGKASADWVRGQLMLYRKLRHQREVPPRLLGIYTVPPEPKEDPGVTLSEARTYRPTEFGQLIAELRG